MNNIAIGTDIVYVPRIRSIIDRFGARFINRIYTQNEITLAPSLESKMYNYFAKRFAAKEALAKAIGTGIGREFEFCDIEVLRDDFKKPYFGSLPSSCATCKASLSLADDRDYAIAQVLLIMDA